MDVEDRESLPRRMPSSLSQGGGVMRCLALGSFVDGNKSGGATDSPLSGSPPPLDFRQQPGWGRAGYLRIQGGLRELVTREHSKTSQDSSSEMNVALDRALSLPSKDEPATTVLLRRNAGETTGASFPAPPLGGSPLQPGQHLVRATSAVELDLQRDAQLREFATTRLKGQEEGDPITQDLFLSVITAPGAAALDVSSLFTFRRPSHAKNRTKSSTILCLNDKQLDIMYALAGCVDVVSVMSRVQHNVRHAVFSIYSIDKIGFATWFKNRRLTPKDGRAFPAPPSLPGTSGRPGPGSAHNNRGAAATPAVGATFRPSLLAMNSTHQQQQQAYTTGEGGSTQPAEPLPLFVLPGANPAPLSPPSPPPRRPATGRTPNAASGPPRGRGRPKTSLTRATSGTGLGRAGSGNSLKRAGSASGGGGRGAFAGRGGSAAAVAAVYAALSPESPSCSLAAAGYQPNHYGLFPLGDSLSAPPHQMLPYLSSAGDSGGWWCEEVAQGEPQLAAAASAAVTRAMMEAAAAAARRRGRGSGGGGGGEGRPSDATYAPASQAAAAAAADGSRAANDWGEAMQTSYDHREDAFAPRPSFPPTRTSRANDGMLLGGGNGGSPRKGYGTIAIGYPVHPLPSREAPAGMHHPLPLSSVGYRLSLPGMTLGAPPAHHLLHSRLSDPPLAHWNAVTSLPQIKLGDERGESPWQPHPQPLPLARDPGIPAAAAAAAADSQPFFSFHLPNEGTMMITGEEGEGGEDSPLGNLRIHSAPSGPKSRGGRLARGTIHPPPPPPPAHLWYHPPPQGQGQGAARGSLQGEGGFLPPMLKSWAEDHDDGEGGQLNGLSLNAGSFTAPGRENGDHPSTPRHQLHQQQQQHQNQQLPWMGLGHLPASNPHLLSHHGMAAAAAATSTMDAEESTVGNPSSEMHNSTTAQRLHQPSSYEEEETGRGGGGGEEAGQTPPPGSAAMYSPEDLNLLDDALCDDQWLHTVL